MVKILKDDRTLKLEIRRVPKRQESANYASKRVFMLGIGITELIIILAVVFFILGGRKIPELSRGFGLAIRNFKKGLHEPDAIDVTPQKDPPSEKENPPEKRQ